jgi:hypothetical protein
MTEERNRVTLFAPAITWRGHNNLAIAFHDLTGIKIFIPMKSDDPVLKMLQPAEVLQWT